MYEENKKHIINLLSILDYLEKTFFKMPLQSKNKYQVYKIISLYNNFIFCKYFEIYQKLNDKDSLNFEHTNSTLFRLREVFESIKNNHYQINDDFTGISQDFSTGLSDLNKILGINHTERINLGENIFELLGFGDEESYQNYINPTVAYLFQRGDEKEIELMKMVLKERKIDETFLIHSGFHIDTLYNVLGALFDGGFVYGNNQLNDRGIMILKKCSKNKTEDSKSEGKVIGGIKAIEETRIMKLLYSWIEKIFNIKTVEKKEDSNDDKTKKAGDVGITNHFIDTMAKTTLGLVFLFVLGILYIFHGEIGEFIKANVSGTSSGNKNESYIDTGTENLATRNGSGNNTDITNITNMQGSGNIHTEIGTQINGTISCLITNGKGQKAWNGHTRGDCEPLSCDTGYSFVNGGCIQNQPQCTLSQHLENNSCVDNVLDCTIQNGGGSKKWQGNTWSSCEVKTCLSGYENMSGKCKEKPVITYSWESGTWGNCSKSCGGGTETRNVVCKGSDGSIGNESQCNGTKPSITQKCNTQSCLNGWRSLDSNCQIDDITIGNQVWAGCNSTLGNGIEYNANLCRNYQGTNIGGTSCYGSNTLESSYNSTYGVNNIWGKLYTWANSPSACPTGRHVPSQGEWTLLLKNLGCSDYGDEYTTGGLCDGLGWAGHTSKNDTNNLVNRLNIPLAGYRFTDGSIFSYRGYNTYFWSSSEYGSSNARGVYLNRNNSTVDRNGRDKTYGFSVRCLKD